MKVQITIHSNKRQPALTAVLIQALPQPMHTDKVFLLKPGSTWTPSAVPAPGIPALPMQQGLSQSPLPPCPPAAQLLFCVKNITKGRKKKQKKSIVLSQIIDDLPSLLSLSCSRDKSLTRRQAWREQRFSKTLPWLPATAAWGFPEPKVLPFCFIILCEFFPSVQQSTLSKP